MKRAKKRPLSSYWKLCLGVTKLEQPFFLVLSSPQQRQRPQTLSAVTFCISRLYFFPIFLEYPPFSLVQIQSRKKNSNDLTEKCYIQGERGNRTYFLPPNGIHRKTMVLFPFCDCKNGAQLMWKNGRRGGILTDGRRQ